MAKGKKIGPLSLENELRSILAQYGNEVYDAVGVAVKDVCDEAIEKLHAANDFGAKKKPHISGAYSRSWVAESVQKTRILQKTVIHNEDHYRLAHLLEKGHVIRNGTARTFGSTTGKPHIRPVEDWMKAELPKKVEEAIQKI